MSREHFIQQLKYFNENYYSITDKNSIYHEFETRLSREELEHFFPMYHKLDVTKISQITLDNDNCFKDFYKLDDETLFFFFDVLTKTDRALKIFDEQVNSVKAAQKEQNRNGALIAKIDDIINFAGETGTHLSKSTIEELEGMKQTLQNRHFTKRQLFESLLFMIIIILGKNNNTKKTSDITNNIMKSYFNVDDITFSRYTNTKLFTSSTYNYGYLKNLILHHS